jgi:phage-related protein
MYGIAPSRSSIALGIEPMTVQYGGVPSDFKPMPDVGSGVYEIRCRDTVDDVFRVMYVAGFANAIHALHAFQKKTQKTAKADTLAAKRYRMIGACHENDRPPLER